MRKKIRLNTSLFFATLLLACCSSCFAISSSTVNDLQKQDFFHTFSGSITTELGISKKENKAGVMVFFSTQHCRFCKRMKATVFNQPSVRQYFRQHFQLLEIDIESDAFLIDVNHERINNIAYAKKNRVRLTPTITFVNLAGETMYRHIGIIADPQEFIWLGEYITSGENSRQSFASFKMKKRIVSRP